MVFGFKIGDTQAFALQDTEPLFDLIHPGAMHRRKVHHETWMLGKPGADFLAMVCTDVVTHEMNRADRLVNLPVQRFEKVDKLPLALPVITVPVDLARTGVKGRKEIEGPCPLVLVLVSVRKVLRLGWPGRSVSRSRLEGGLLIYGQDQFIERQRPRVEVDQFGDGGIEGGVPRLLGIEPHMMAPGFELMCGQNPAYGGHRNVGHYALRDQLSREFGAIPLGEATPQQIRAFAGQAHDVDGDLGGKTHPWRRGQGRRRARPDAGRENAWPSGGPRSVARRPPAPPQIARPLLPAGG